MQQAVQKRGSMGQLQTDAHYRRVRWSPAPASDERFAGLIAVLAIFAVVSNPGFVIVIMTAGLLAMALMQTRPVVATVIEGTR
jgi:hypothetical protein